MLRNSIRAETGISATLGQDRASPLFVRSVEKAMAVLSAFHHAEGPLTLSDIAARAGIDRSAAQRMVHTLRALDYIGRDANGHGYLPGVSVLDHTLDFLRLHPLVRQGTPILQDLRAAIRERIDLSLFDDLRMVYAVRLQTRQQTLNASLLGHSVPTFCTAGGLAVLARLPEETARDLVERSDRRPFTPHTMSEVEEIMEAVAQTRSRGYALAQNQILSGEIAIGFAILDAQGAPVAAIHIAGSLAEWTPDDFCARAAPLGQQAARALSKY